MFHPFEWKGVTRERVTSGKEIHFAKVSIQLRAQPPAFPFVFFPNVPRADPAGPHSNARSILTACIDIQPPKETTPTMTVDSAGSAPQTTDESPQAPAGDDRPAGEQEPQGQPDDDGADGATGDTDGTGDTAAGREASKSTRAKGTGKGKSGVRKTRTVELTLTVTGTADGEWQAELKHGSKWVAKGLDIPAAAVSRAARELHEDLSGPIDEVIDAAKEQQQAKVAQLEAELEQARQALAELES